MTSRVSHWPLSILSTVAAVFSMLLPLVLVRLITAQEVGIFKIFYLYLLLVHGFTMVGGFMNGLAYWSGQSEPRRTSAVQASAVVVLGLAALTFVLALLLRSWIASACGWSADEALIFACMLLVANPASFLDEVAVATGKIWCGALFSASFEIARALTVLYVAYLTRDLDSLLFAYLGVTSLRAVCGYGLAWRMRLFGWQFDRRDLKEVFRYAMPVSLASISVILVGNADQVLISTVLPPRDFALYALGCLSVPPLFILEQSVTRVLIPQLARKFASRESADAARLYREAVGSMSFLIVPAVAGMMTFSEPIVELLFTSKFSEAAIYLRMFAVSYLVLLLPYDAVARARGHASWILGSYSFFSVFSIGLTLGGMTLWGAKGALLSMLLARAIMRGYSVFHVARSEEWKISEFVPLHLLLAEGLLAGGLSELCLAASGRFGSPRGWFFVCGGAFGVLFLVADRALRIAFAGTGWQAYSFPFSRWKAKPIPAATLTSSEASFEAPIKASIAKR